MKIENKATIKLPAKTNEVIESIFDILPREHLRGLTKVVLVDRIDPDSRMIAANVTELPGLYHPRQGTQQPWCEISLRLLLQLDEGFFKRFAAKLNFKPNLAYLVLSLQAQHYYLTLSHGIKKHQYEAAMRAYVEQHHRSWQEKRSGWRGKLFKPLQPFINRWARRLRKRYEEEKRRKQG
ncbi:MAG: hypothetical protein EBZ36_18835 [Acidobacteria bacterium]|nr:hypothetical protein [Acidobacteriota bacterium]